MTVQQLISELEKIKDRELPVWVHVPDLYIEPVSIDVLRGGVLLTGKTVRGELA
jgi:hypothetical protein